MKHIDARRRIGFDRAADMENNRQSRVFRRLPFCLALCLACVSAGIALAANPSLVGGDGDVGGGSTPNPGVATEADGLTGTVDPGTANGPGGDVAYEIVDPDQYSPDGTLTITGGMGGDGSGAANGRAGGSATLNGTASILTEGGITIQAGTGGDGDARVGGTGGNATLDIASGSLTNQTGDILIGGNDSGAAGVAYGGAAGATTVTAGAITAIGGNVSIAAGDNGGNTTVTVSDAAGGVISGYAVTVAAGDGVYRSGGIATVTAAELSAGAGGIGVTGGSGGDNVTGGAGGVARLYIRTFQTLDGGDIEFTAGGGGDGETSGGGALGGSVRNSTTGGSIDSSGEVRILAGSGGDASATHAGGAGGEVSLANNMITGVGDVIIAGGDAGTDDSGFSGGSGGGVTLNFVTTINSLDSQSGSGAVRITGGDTAGSGDGGDVSMSAVDRIDAGSGGVTIRAGDSSGDGDGGDVDLSGTRYINTGGIGAISILGGSNTPGLGQAGNVVLSALYEVVGSDVTIDAGDAAGFDLGSSLTFLDATGNMTLAAGSAVSIDETNLNSVIAGGTLSVSATRDTAAASGGNAILSTYGNYGDFIDAGALILDADDAPDSAEAASHVQVKTKDLSLTASGNNLIMTADATASIGGGGVSLVADYMYLASSGISTWNLDKNDNANTADGGLILHVEQLHLGFTKNGEITGSAALTLTASTDCTDQDIRFRLLVLHRGSSFTTNLFWADGTTNASETFYMQHLNVQENATLTLGAGSVYKPYAVGGHLGFGPLSDSIVATPALQLGTGTSLDLTGATDAALLIDFAPDTDWKVLYDNYQNAAIIAGDAGSVIDTSNYSQTLGGYHGLTYYSLDFGVNSDNSAFTGVGRFQQMDGSPYADSAAASLWTAVMGQRALDRAIVSLDDRLAPRTFDLGLVATGGKFRNDTGSHVDLSTINLNLAGAYKFETGRGHLIAGAFFEFGNGSYDTHNSLRSIGDVRGDGKTRYYGGGLFVHNRFHGGTYFEASLRAGSVRNEYDIRRIVGAGYDISNLYHGAHLGLGRKWAIGPGGELDLYGKALWNRVADDDFRTDARERLELDAVDSFRTRLGGRYAHAWREDAKAYAGLAWEQEYDGKAKGRGDNIVIRDTAELRGASFFMEAGLSLNPNRGNLFIDVGVYGVVGQERGLGGTLGLRARF